MRGLELPEAGGVAECYLSASGPAILRVRQGHQAAQAEAPHHSRLHRSGWSGLTLCSRLSSNIITNLVFLPLFWILSSVLGWGILLSSNVTSSIFGFLPTG